MRKKFIFFLILHTIIIYASRDVPKNGMAPPNPASVITYGNFRATLFTNNFFRFEYSSTGTFDDRATKTVINRFTETPKFQKSISNNSLIINVGSNVIVYNSETPNGDCSQTSVNTDASNPLRSKNFPNGQSANSVGDCCSLCQSDPTCNYYVYSNSDKFCWPLSDSGGSHSASDRILGIIPRCTQIPNTDSINPQRSNNFPNGASASSPEECCALCGSDPSCRLYVFAPSMKTCWPLSSSQGTVSASDRTFGSRSTPFQGLTVTGSNGIYPDFKWTPETQPKGNLLGTYQALDCYSNPVQCYNEYWGAMQPGLLSTDGWVVIDDSFTQRYTSSESDGWPWWTTPTGEIDLYFLAQPGRGFSSALKDYSLVAGLPAVPPRSVFGIFWSRYWPYSEQTIVSEVLSGYAKYDIPLDVLVFDMDWHNEPNEPGCQSWGNYDWNTSLFPNPGQFCDNIKSVNNVLGKPLNIILNVHPQTGIDHCDERYAQIAERMGVDPNSKQTIPCNFGDKNFTNAVFDVYYNADPLRKVDWWWTDYGGCGGGDAMFWSNYVFDTMPSAFPNNARPMVLSRYGGLGNHRYPIGFSGDTFQHEITLDFLIETTKMAANTLFGYWSHDVGGFHTGSGAPGDANPTNKTGSELLLRWVQFAVVSPIFRTHCDHCERRIWMFQYHFPQLLQAFNLRSALGSYIYTEAMNAYHSGISIVHSQYIEYPTHDESYTYTHQYFFGSYLLAAPISKMSDSNGFSEKSVWIPPSGNLWFDWAGKNVYQPGTVVTRNYTTFEIPIFVPETAIIPLKNAPARIPTPDITWTIWTSRAHQSGTVNAQYSLYEDDGVTLAYQNSGNSAITKVECQISSTSITCKISPTVGNFGQPETRKHSFQIRGFSGKIPQVTVNGNAISGVSTCQTDTLVCPSGSLIFDAGTFSIRTSIDVIVTY